MSLLADTWRGEENCLIKWALQRGLIFCPPSCQTWRRWALGQTHRAGLPSASMRHCSSVSSSSPPAACCRSTAKRKLQMRRFINVLALYDWKTCDYTYICTSESQIKAFKNILLVCRRSVRAKYFGDKRELRSHQPTNPPWQSVSRPWWCCFPPSWWMTIFA